MNQPVRLLLLSPGRSSGHSTKVEPLSCAASCLEMFYLFSHKSVGLLLAKPFPESCDMSFRVHASVELISLIWDSIQRFPSSHVLRQTRVCACAASELLPCEEPSRALVCFLCVGALLFLVVLLLKKYGVFMKFSRLDVVLWGRWRFYQRDLLWPES